ncbi:RrF2 family transcriptional regulator [Micromonospora sp. NPDC049282]|uniref:RrF2 family transcriptional regulator n=1 Tax=Micromonospora sp. NPDC049282 TaxID=3364269 RepID=UPI003713A37D
MQMSQGVEWALHTCLNLSWLPPDQAVPTGKLAAFYELPAAYLNKQLQALVRAGILSSQPGPRGGFRLARAPEDITLLDVVLAIEGPDEAFVCNQILRHGPGGRPEVDYRQTCLLARGMRRADIAWRRELAAQTLAEIREDVERHFPETPRNTRARFAGQ